MGVESLRERDKSKSLQYITSKTSHANYHVSQCLRTVRTLKCPMACVGQRAFFQGITLSLSDFHRLSLSLPFPGMVTCLKL